MSNATVFKKVRAAGLIAGLLTVLCSGTVQAQFAKAPLSGAEIRAALFGQRISGEYPSGLQWAEQFNADGTTNYVEQGKGVKGTMQLDGNIVCFAYSNAPQTGGCFEVWQRSTNCFDFYATNEAASLDAKRFGRAWSARGWYPDQPATCTTEQIS